MKEPFRASESEPLLLFITLTPSFVRTAALRLNRRVRRFLLGFGHPETARSESHTHGHDRSEISAATSDHGAR